MFPPREKSAMTFMVAEGITRGISENDTPVGN